ncbi:nuclear pore complex protein Nup50 [Strongylocentrotus purpuratus]|uniref:RanBD1 domain-containing protein n=1 Tax=Strongylocentrotus purpuratus TaxID=7668 RepID=A0A7M7P2I1_STRPU|nr:nuclear pore complex protein Nup50 [Strongylocentrotus purpuratus]
MSKRRAGMELTHDNWDQEEEEAEEAGTFSVADKDTLSRRPMIKAKRRVTEKQQDESEPAAQTPFAAFKGFSGFGSATQQTSTASFGFKPVSTASPTAPVTQSTVSFGSAASSNTVKLQAKTTFSFKPSAESQPSTNMFTLGKTDMDPKTSSNGSSLFSKSENGGKGTDAYADEIRALNRSVSAWIQKHVEGNPVCDLTPIFEDYKKHLGEIEEKQAKGKEGGGGGEQSKTKPQLATVSPLSTEQGKSSSTTAVSFTGFKFAGTPAAAAESEKAPSAPKVSFGFGAASSDNKGFSFGAATSDNKSLGFGGASSDNKSLGFGSSSSSSSTSGSMAGKFSFGDLTKAAPSSQVKKEEEEESDEPPKVEVKVIEEKDSLYSTRCKIFYKKESEFKERGVGMLHIKDTGGSAQLLIRADTTLGNVILNVGVTSGMLPHFTKQGKNKNNVMMLSPLNPPADKKCPKCKKNYLNPQESTACEEGCNPDATPLLLRVKTEADADKLIEQIKKICED